jgi:hypothetical protein
LKNKKQDEFPKLTQLIHNNNNNKLTEEINLNKKLVKTNNKTETKCKNAKKKQL